MISDHISLSHTSSPLRFLQQTPKIFKLQSPKKPANLRASPATQQQYLHQRYHLSAMEEYMRDSMRKLALWYTKTFKPITTHEELEPIMATLGFVSVISPSQPDDCGIGAVAWKEYVYVAGGGRGRFGEMTPRPRLPSPRIDGLHICTYHAFIDAVDFWLEMSDFSDFFHIRGMPLHRVQDRNRKWRKMEEDDSVFVYRDGTLDPATHSLYQSKKKSNAGDGSGAFSSTSAIIRWKRSSRDSTSGGGSSSLFVPLKDIIV